MQYGTYAGPTNAQGWLNLAISEMMILQYQCLPEQLLLDVLY